MKPRKIEFAFFFVVVLLINTALQYFWGAQTSELWHTDDGSHYISGTLIQEWIRSGFPNPLSFAYDFNAHFPIVGIGLWGPAFYVIEGVWQLVFGASKGAAFMLSAAVAALTSTIIYAISKVRCGTIAAACFAAAFSMLPLGFEGIVSYGLDLPVALFCLLSALAFARYLASERRGGLVLFGFFAIFCLFIKGNGLALGLFVPLAILLGQRFRVFLKLSLWLAGALIIAIALPWYLLTFKMSASGFRHAWGIEFFLMALPQNIRLVTGTLGVFLVPLLLLGIVRTLRDTRDLLGRVVLALFLAVFLFQSLVPASLNGRYLLPLLAPALILCADGWSFVWQFVVRTSPRLEKPLLGLGPVAFFASLLLLTYLSPRGNHGLIEAARVVTAQPQFDGKSVLIASFDVGETAFIAEMAMALDGRPSAYVIRGSRLLGGGGYNNFEYSTPYNSVEEVAERLASFKIPYLVISTEGRAKEWKHVTLLDEMLHTPGKGWVLLWRYDGPKDVRVYGNPAFAQVRADHAKIRALTQPKKMGSVTDGK